MKHPVRVTKNRFRAPDQLVISNRVGAHTEEVARAAVAHRGKRRTADTCSVVVEKYAFTRAKPKPARLLALMAKAPRIPRPWVPTEYADLSQLSRIGWLSRRWSAKPSDPSASSDTDERLLEFLQRPPGWDGDSAEPIGKSAYVGAIRLLAISRAAGFPDPHVEAAGDGSIAVDWRFENGYVVGVFVSDVTRREPFAIIGPDAGISQIVIESDEGLIELLREVRGRSG